MRNADYSLITPGSLGVAHRRVIEGSAEVKKSTPDSQLGHLEQEHAIKALELASARRTLTTYRRGCRAFLVAALAATTMVVAGIATAITSAMVGADAGAAVGALEVSGGPITVLSTTALVIWHYIHRIDTKKVGHYQDVRQTVGYIDPQLNVQIAEINYSIALTKLAEHKGQTH